MTTPRDTQDPNRTHMFFILSTGRCGSTTIARLLSQVPGVVCAHEPHPRLIEEAKEYVERTACRDDIVALLRATRLAPKWTHLYGESNHCLAWLADAVCQAFPDAYYIWLIRDGLDVVASLDHRRVYRGMQGIWGQNMPFGDAVGDMGAREWQRLSPFARCCWRWSWTNRTIRQALEGAGVRWLYVRLEDLQDRLADIGSFLGVDIPPQLCAPVANASKSPVTKCNDWDRGQRQSFESLCGPLMDELYPSWREALAFSLAQRVRNEALSYFSYRKPTGRALRHVAGTVVPQRMRAPLARVLAGRGLLNHPNN